MKKAISLPLLASLLFFSSYTHASSTIFTQEGEIRRQHSHAAAAASQVVSVSSSDQVGFIEIDTISSADYDRRQKFNRWKSKNSSSNYFLSRPNKDSAFLRSCYFDGETCKSLSLNELVQHYAKDESVIFNGFSFNAYTKKIILFYSKNE